MCSNLNPSFKVKGEGHIRIIWEIPVCSISFLHLFQAGSYFTNRVLTKKGCTVFFNYVCRSSVKVVLDDAFFFQSIYIYSQLGLIWLLLYITCNKALGIIVCSDFMILTKSFGGHNDLFVISFSLYIIYNLFLIVAPS